MKPGDVIDNKNLQATFAVSNTGGMRRSRANNVLVVVSDHTKGLYDDRWEANVLHYTGMGKKGAQQLDRYQNRTLRDSQTNGVAVHLFEVFEPGRYVYAGEVELAAKPYQERQPDIEGTRRPVWMFPLKLKQDSLRPIPPAHLIRQLQATRERKLTKLPTAKLKELAKKAHRKPAKRIASTEQFVRDPYVATYVKQAAHGRCDLCKRSAPFKKDGRPFLHCHHVLWLARGGPDIIQNAVALCPNCHERMHQLDREKDKNTLVKRISERDSDLPPFDVFAPMIG